MANHEEEQAQFPSPGAASHPGPPEKAQQSPDSSADPSEAREPSADVERKSRSSSVVLADLERAVIRALRGLFSYPVVLFPSAAAVWSRSAECGAASESLQQVVKLGADVLGV